MEDNRTNKDEYIDFKANHRSHENTRNRAKQLHYSREGIKKLLASPLKGILLILILIIAFIAAWETVDAFIPSMITVPLLVPVITYTIRALIPAIILLLLAGFLFWFGKPKNAREIESDVAAAFGVTKDSNRYKRPFLISSKPVKGSDVTEYVFWSRWINVEIWNKQEYRDALLGALNAHSIEDFTNGENNRRIIVIRVGSGATPVDRGEMTDDEL